MYWFVLALLFRSSARIGGGRANTAAASYDTCYSLQNSNTQFCLKCCFRCLLFIAIPLLGVDVTITLPQSTICLVIGRHVLELRALQFASYSAPAFVHSYSKIGGGWGNTASGTYDTYCTCRNVDHLPMFHKGRLHRLVHVSSIDVVFVCSYAAVAGGQLNEASGTCDLFVCATEEA